MKCKIILTSDPYTVYDMFVIYSDEAKQILYYYTIRVNKKRDDDVIMDCFLLQGGKKDNDVMLC